MPENGVAGKRVGGALSTALLQSTDYDPSFGPGLIRVGKEPSKRGWHDLVAGTEVVRAGWPTELEFGATMSALLPRPVRWV